MLITKFRVKGFYGLNVSMDLGPLTIVTGPPGSGKSLIIELIRRFINGFKDKVVLDDLAGLEGGSMELTISLNEQVKQKLEDMGHGANYLVISLDVDGTGYTYAVKLDDKEVLVVEGRQGRGRVKYPVNVDVKDASTLLDPGGLTPISSAATLVESESLDYESLLSLVNVLRGFVTTMGIYKLGPYINFRGYSKGAETVGDYVGEHGEYTLELLSTFFTDPRRDGDVRLMRKVLGELGFRNFRVGWYGGKIVVSYIDKRGVVHIGDELPCYAKTILAITTQLIMSRKPSLILIDNADYCLSEELGPFIAKLLGNYITGDRQVIMEVRSKWLINSLKMPHIVVHNLT
ncbi:ATP-binding protein [Vulcanisaeta thermophila]|uniref:ATP-binding protein n=1 Tax=Vulcanisaeta thermophila TaxID=867917 RepID=UPI000853511D|nr:ATP-binding protein [Vulcanisaeta thermophila]